MKRFYIRALLLSISIIVIIKIVDQFIIQDELIHYNSKKVTAGEEEIDFIMLGNSLSQQSYNSDRLDSIFNSNSICLGSSAQHFYVTNEIFKKIISNPKSHPKKLLVINISPYQFSTSINETVKFLQFAALDEVDYSLDYFEFLHEFYEISEYPKALSSTIRFHKKLGEEIVASKQRLDYISKINADGFVYDIDHQLDNSKRESRKNFMKLAANYKEKVNGSTTKSIDAKSEKIILNIIEKCRINKINFLFVTPPAIDMVYEQSNYGYFKYLNELLSSHNAPYFNANEYIEVLGLDLDDYSDYSHLNLNGNKKFTDLFSQYIKKNNNILPNSNTSAVSMKYNEITNSVIKATTDSLTKVNMNLESYDEVFKGESVFFVERDKVTSPSYLSTKQIKITPGKVYKASVILKKIDDSDLFGLRIQSTYPNRVDAVFDLNSKKMRESIATAEFTLINAQMTKLENGWYRCSITAKINSNNVSLILGPSTMSTPTSAWESATSTKNKTLLLPSSLSLEQL